MKLVLTIMFFICGIIQSAQASSGGITGRSQTGCGGCHGGQNNATTVSLREGAGPFTVQAGTSKTFTAVVAHATLTKAGMNLSIKNSSNVNAGTYSALSNCNNSGGELTHPTPANMNGGEAEFGFTWTAPSTPGTYTIYMAGNAVNNNGNANGDSWNIMNSITINVVSGSSISLTSQTSPSTVCRSSAVNVTWTGDGLSGNTIIEASPNGNAPWTPIGSVPASTLNYTWNISDNQAFSSNYRIRVLNGTAIDTIDAPISILPIPEILTHSSPFDTACIGTNKTLSITVKADENFLTFQWYKNNELIPGATSRTLNITQVTESMAGIYTCRVKGCSEINSNPTSLFVPVQTAIISQPSSLNGCKNAPAALNITANGHNLSYQWKKNGIDIPNTNKSSYSITSLQDTDAGTYTCIVTGYCGNPITSSSATISVIPSPVANLAFSNDTALCVGKPFKVSATGTGGTITSYIWKKNGTTLSITDSILNIASLSSTDAGSYSVAVMNSCNEMSSEKTINVIVRELPMILLQPRDTTAVEGTIASMRVIASGTDLRYQWRKNGINRPADTMAVLMIQSAVLSDSGSYDCIVSNACQTVTSSAKKLSITKAPSGPKLTLSQAVIDFGCIDKGTNQDKTIEGLLKNEGEEDLTITAMNIAGSQASQFSIIGSKTYTLTPGQSQTIVLKFTAGESLNNTADITIKSNSTTGDKVLALIGRSCFERIDTTMFNLGKLISGSQSLDTIVRICNTGSKDASITGLSIIGSDKFAVKNLPTFPLSIPIAECKNINISFNASQNGTYTAGLLITSSKGTYTIPLKVEIATSIEEEDISMLRIMPNPAHSICSISGIRSTGIESISMYTLMGGMIQMISGPFMDDTIDIPLSGLHSGIYVLRLQSNDGRIFTRQIMKQE